jgi:hypothetical protein
VQRRVGELSVEGVAEHLGRAHALDLDAGEDVRAFAAVELDQGFAGVLELEAAGGGSLANQLSYGSSIGSRPSSRSWKGFSTFQKQNSYSPGRPGAATGPERVVGGGAGGGPAGGSAPRWDHHSICASSATAIGRLRTGSFSSARRPETRSSLLRRRMAGPFGGPAGKPSWWNGVADVIVPGARGVCKPARQSRVRRAAMKSSGQFLFLCAGLGLGVVGSALYYGSPRPVEARPNDRFEDYAMCTGACAVNPRAPTDGVWLLDYRSGKLMGTVIDRNAGKITGWAEVDLTSEFNVAPKAGVHFLMTTGNIATGQAALYVAEVNSGKFGVYTLGPDVNTQNGVSIRRHDLVMFRRAN